MEPSWKQINLSGGGLQSANLRLARLLKRRRIAYGLLLLFPFGAHRAYLDDRRGALLYCAGTGATAFCMLVGVAPVAWGLSALLVVRALLDIAWIETAVARINKRLRIEVYMSQTSGAPAGYKGRFENDHTMTVTPPDQERAPSFAEQERQLRDAVSHLRRRRP